MAFYFPAHHCKSSKAWKGKRALLLNCLAKEDSPFVTLCPAWAVKQGVTKVLSSDLLSHLAKKDSPFTVLCLAGKVAQCGMIKEPSSSFLSHPAKVEGPFVHLPCYENGEVQVMTKESSSDLIISAAKKARGESFRSSTHYFCSQVQGDKGAFTLAKRKEWSLIKGTLTASPSQQEACTSK